MGTHEPYDMYLFQFKLRICLFEPLRDFQQCGMSDQQRLRPACAYAQSGQSLCLSLEYSMAVKLLTEHHLEFLSLKGGYTGWSESTLVKHHIVGNLMSRLICRFCNKG